MTHKLKQAGWFHRRPRKKNKRRLIRWILAVIVLSAIAGVIGYGLQDRISLQSLRLHHDEFRAAYANAPYSTAAVFFAGAVFFTAISFPGAMTFCMLAAGAIFGLPVAVFVMSFASALGATIAFWFSRFVFRNRVRAYFRKRYGPVHRGIEKDGPLYLFSLRLIPTFPFFVVNLAMGMTRMRTRTFYWVSQLGLLPSIFVYANAGTELGKLESVRGILNPQLVLSFILLGILPIAAKHLFARIPASRRR